ncbi:phage major capsid protein [Stappia sp. GBMRC 2046]|uniref:Phage major capsid protein n=1 Tax=Stappia sediminis TaxID=2692190 RepID=A0A7X3LV65_9HYPH|nr:phage major capsid protein [Stappia sediminis]MXN65709.1 phage major capsid protein [Stappia sediminis]
MNGYDTHSHPEPFETKAGLPEADIRRAVEDLQRTFEVYCETNDDRLSEIETRSASDTVTRDKLERIDAALDKQMRRLDEISLKGSRPQREAGGERMSSTAQIEHKSAFETYVRSGREENLRPLEEKALSVGSDPDGGYLVPEETESEILRRLASVSPIRAIAGTRQVSASVFKKPFSIAGPQTGWVGETAARPQTTGPTLAELAFPTMELYAMPAATATLLEDAAVDVDAWIAEEVETAFAEQEGAAFVNGDGANKPRGFLDYPQVDESAWTWGNLGTVSTGVSGAFPASDPADVLIDLIYALKSGYRQNARFVMNRRTQGAVRKLKDGDGNYIWQPPAAVGQPATLMTFPVSEAEDMPDIAADAPAIAFGDFRRGYLIVDRTGVRILRDPFSAKPYVLFYTTKRVGGGVQDFDAIKLLSFAL